MNIKFLGHSAVELNTDINILIDPFISKNPLCRQSPDDFFPDAILLTHGHRDHLGDTIEIALRAGCVVYAVAELAGWLVSQGAKVHGFNIGGSFLISETKVTSIEAVHSSSTPDGSYAGVACGFVIEYAGQILYHAGDTSQFAGMSLIGSKYKIDAAMLPIGGNYTMDIADAVRAAEMLSPRICIPIHYNTFPVITCDPLNFKRQLADISINCEIMSPGDEITL